MPLSAFLCPNATFRMLLLLMPKVVITVSRSENSVSVGEEIVSESKKAISNLIESFLQGTKDFLKRLCFLIHHGSFDRIGFAEAPLEHLSDMATSRYPSKHPHCTSQIASIIQHWHIITRNIQKTQRICNPPKSKLRLQYGVSQSIVAS